MSKRTATGTNYQRTKVARRGDSDDEVECSDEESNGDEEQELSPDDEDDDDNDDDHEDNEEDDEGGEVDEDIEEDDGDQTDENESEFEDDDPMYSAASKLPKENAEVLLIPVLHTRSEVDAYVRLIENSPESKVIRFEDGYRPRTLIVEAVCKHGKFTSLELQQGDWEAWISRFPKIIQSLPHLKRLIIAGASQSGCGGYDELILAALDCPELELLDVSNNDEDMEQCPALARLICEHPCLKEISMGDNDLSEDQETLVVQAIREATNEKKLVLEELHGLTLNELRWREVLGLQGQQFESMSNREILSHLKHS